MSNVDIVKTHTPEKTFRVAGVRGKFDFDAKTVEHRVKFDAPFETEDWKIGAIVGSSGSGKSISAREMFGTAEVDRELKWTRDCFLDDFADALTLDEIIHALTAVGFSSPPDWLKPFNVLSTGQKFRATLARRLLEAKNGIVVFDEFTSVVDRVVARSCCVALEKYLRKRKDSPRFVAVTCHHDIVDYLLPDWVVNVDAATFTKRGRRQRKQLKIEIHRTNRDAWRFFRRHHYLSGNLHSTAKCFLAIIEGIPVGFASYVKQIHPHFRNRYREHRTVILPDYQGCGIGNALSEFVARHVIDQGFRYGSVTSHPSMIRHRVESPLWRVSRTPSRKNKPGKKSRIDRTSQARLTCSFEFVGAK